MELHKRRTHPIGVRPLIGVTGPDSGGWPAWFFTRIALYRAGAKAKRITPCRPSDINGLDGLIIGGGADIDPELYREEPMLPQIRRERKRTHRSLFDYIFFVLIWVLRRLFSSPWHVAGDRGRDKLETKLLDDAVKAGLPILGICRGMQLINVEFGGSLHQDIAEFYEETPQLHTHLPKKKVEVEVGSRLHGLLGETLARVNSLHHQSVKRLGKGLRISAVEPNGVVQAIEHSEYPFIIGVQWHPEFLPQEPNQQAIFRELVKTAVARRLVAVSPTLYLPPTYSFKTD